MTFPIVQDGLLTVVIVILAGGFYLSWCKLSEYEFSGWKNVLYWSVWTVSAIIAICGIAIAFLLFNFPIDPD